MIASGKLVSWAAAAGLGLAIAGCGRSEGIATLAGGPLAPKARPTVVEVTCDPSGTITSTSTAVVDRDGLHLRVTDHAGLNGTTILFFGSTGWNGGGTLGSGGGDEVPAGTSDLVLQVPPGDVSLECTYGLGSKTPAPVKVRANDPNGYYLPGTLAALGCSSSSTPSWSIGPTRGKTAIGAVDALAVAVGKRPRLRARLAPIGYVGSASRTYLLDRGGTPWATAVVFSDGGEYVAGLDVLC